MGTVSGLFGSRSRQKRDLVNTGSQWSRSRKQDAKQFDPDTKASIDGLSRPPLRDEPVSPKADLNEYSVVSGLCQGGYSQVVLVKDPVTGGFAAMKVIDKMKINRACDRRRLRNELHVLSRIEPSPFLHQLHTAFESPTHIFVITSFLGGGDLFYHLAHYHGGETIGEEAAKFILAEVILGLEHVHAHRIIHRDIKIENIMLDYRGHVKLIDFGLAIEITEDISVMSATGSLSYMAPELLEHCLGGRHTDWWALGVLSHELITGRAPWSSLTNKEVIKQEIATVDVAPPVDASFAAGMFIVSLLSKDVVKRAGTVNGARDLKENPFFHGLDWALMEVQQIPPVLVPNDMFPFLENECEAALELFLKGQENAAANEAATEFWGGLERVSVGPAHNPMGREEIVAVIRAQRQDAEGLPIVGGKLDLAEDELPLHAWLPWHAAAQRLARPAVEDANFRRTVEVAKFAAGTSMDQKSLIQHMPQIKSTRCSGADDVTPHAQDPTSSVAKVVG